MRPLRLELKGFTAYRETTVLDFEDLDLFAITGPTGSGKSSLLDALTYALYGKAPRVGKGVGQLIAQGQPRLSVILEFEVEGLRYRVFRDTPARGSSSIRLERQIDGQWRSFGDGADRIGEAGALIEGLVGLDYAGFNRSIVLPQGEFAGFLKGEAKDRREILTELLGLELFVRMAKRAGEEAAAAKAGAQATRKMLDEKYSGVDKKAVRDARGAAKEAAEKSETMIGVERSLDRLAKEWQAQTLRIEALERNMSEADEVARSAGLLSEGLDQIAAEFEEGKARASSLEQTAAAAALEAERAGEALAQAEDRLGTGESLAAVKATLEELKRANGRTEAAQARLSESRSNIESRDAALELARRAAAEAGPALERAEATVKEAEAEHERVHTADRVAALVRGRARGDPCPVCDRPLEVVPKIDARGLDEAVRMLETAGTTQRRAEAAWSKAERDLALAERDLDSARDGARHLEADLSAVMAERGAVLAQVQAAFGGALPDDPVAEVDARGQELRGAREFLIKCEAASREAVAAADVARDAFRSLESRTGELIGSLRGLQVARLVDRSRELVPDLDLPVRRGVPSEPSRAAAAARASATGANEVSRRLQAAATEARSARDGVLDRARHSLPAGMPLSLVTDVEEVVGAVRATSRALVEEATSARLVAEGLAQRLAERQDLESQVKVFDKGAAVHHALASELRADRLIDFLQGEALALLADAGSERLLFLSQGRYRLAFEGDEFYVEDAQNGDERRSVRTLSGGETFLASLALALALSDQIQSLAVTTRARLRSLFIDEGFGALDPEVLEVASEALSQLGGQDRLVGVITHVSELAERLPVRIEVKKLPSGSRLERVS